MSTEETPEEMAKAINVLSARNAQLRDAAELRRRRDRDHHERVEAAARRAAEDALGVAGRTYVEQVVAQVSGDLDALIHVVDHLPDRPKKVDVEHAHAVATRARATLKLARSRETAPEMWRRVNAETARLRGVITDAACGWHNEDRPTDPDGVGCICRGCLLIVAMDTAGLGQVPR